MRYSLLAPGMLASFSPGFAGAGLRSWGRPWRFCPGGQRRQDGGKNSERARKIIFPGMGSPGGPALFYWFCGGRAAIMGASLAILPRRAAPPGEPRSSKNSALAAV